MQLCDLGSEAFNVAGDHAEMLAEIAQAVESHRKLIVAVVNQLKNLAPATKSLQQ